ncbi:ATP-binding protein [Nonomuraea sp. NPDC003804]|uniref:sensor histidine kinase n=1 Tax=Nonomuraea sp. NPDC003804 TaxID=3154547 RepID=UPI0033B7E6C8
MERRKHLRGIVQRRATDLAGELDHQLAEWSRRTGIAVETWALPSERVPRRVVEAVLGCFAEALSNVEKHSGARAVSVAVTVGDKGLRLTVSDEGRGFVGPAAGRGIVAMRAHLASVGGRCTVTSTLGGGTTVSGVIPRAALRGL